MRGWFSLVALLIVLAVTAWGLSKQLAPPVAVPRSLGGSQPVTLRQLPQQIQTDLQHQAQQHATQLEQASGAQP